MSTDTQTQQEEITINKATPVADPPVESPVEAAAPVVPETKEVPAATTNNEDDLDDLDDLLDDFADEVLSKPPGASTATTGTPAVGASATHSVHGDNNEEAKDPTRPLEVDFQSGIADLIKDLNIEDPDTQKQFEQLVADFELNHRQEVEAEEKKPANFEYVMKETMERLKKSGETVDEKIKNDPMGGNPEDMLTQLLAGLGGDGGEGSVGDLDMSKLLVDMLEQLSSKEILYEPIKDLNSKFPEYLQKNKDSLEDGQYRIYQQQYEMTNQILAVFDASDYNDGDKQKRDQVNVLLEALQELGQPPAEIVGEVGDLPGFGGGAGCVPGSDSLNFSEKDLPPGFDKQLEEGCKQQ